MLAKANDTTSSSGSELGSKALKKIFLRGRSTSIASSWSASSRRLGATLGIECSRKLFVIKISAAVGVVEAE